MGASVPASSEADGGLTSPVPSTRVVGPDSPGVWWAGDKAGAAASGSVSQGGAQAGADVDK